LFEAQFNKINLKNGDKINTDVMLLGDRIDAIIPCLDPKVSELDRNNPDFMKQRCDRTDQRFM